MQPRRRATSCGKGATQTELSMQQEQVHRAELELEQANIALSDATLNSPFDGIVSALPVKIGQVAQCHVAGGNHSHAGHPHLRAERRRDGAAVDQGRPDRRRALRRDPGQRLFPIQVFAIGLSPETQQGVIIYKVKCKLLGDIVDPRPSPGMNGSASIITEQRPNVVAIPSALRAQPRRREGG